MHYQYPISLIREDSFWCKVHNSENVVLQTLSSLKHNLFTATGSKYDICLYDALVKSAVWNSFATSVNAAFM